MVAIFTTFIVLSGIPTSAAVKKTSKKTAKKVKVVTKKVVKKTAPAKKPAKPVANKPVVNTTLAAADKAVNKAEALTNGDTYDLVGNDTDLSNAQTAITNALEAVVKLNKDSSAYKGYMARIDAANKNVVDAMDQRDADNQAKLDAATEVAAEATADKAVAAVEAAPLATAADLAAAKDLGTTAATAVAAVKDATKAAAYTARLQAVVTSGLALQAKLDKAAADAALAAAQALLPAKIVTVSAVDGTITVTFDKKPLTTVSAADFTVTNVVTTGSAVTSTVTPTSVTVTSDTAVTIVVPTIAAIATSQAVAYSVAYTTAAAVTVAAPYTVAALPAVTVSSVTASNYKTLVVKFNKAVDPTTVNATNVKVYLNGATTASTVDSTSAVAGVAGQVGYILSSDNTTLYIVFGTAMTASNTVKLTIDGVVDAAIATSKISGYTSTTTVNDVTLPALTSVVAKNAKTLVLTFSEPINAGTATYAAISNNLKIDGASCIATVTPNHTANTLTYALTTAMAAGSHTIATTGFVDFAGFVVPDASNTVAITADTTLPVINSAVVLDKDTIQLTFNKDLDPNNLGTYTVDTHAATASVGSSANIVKLALSTSLNIAAVVQINVSYNGTADVIGNKVTTATTYTFHTTDDTTLPSVTASLDGTTNKNFVTLTFTKPMAVGVGQIAVLDSAGNRLLQFGVPTATPAQVSSGTPITAWDSTHKILTLTATTLGLNAVSGANYTLDITGMTDNSIRLNAMLETKPAITAVSTSIPSVLNVVKTAGATTAADTLTVYFSKAMNSDSLKNLSNYNVTLGTPTVLSTLSGASVSSVATDLKSVVLTVPNAYVAATSVTVYGCLDTVGNLLTTYTGAPTTVAAQPMTVSSATATSTSTVKVVMNQAIGTYDPSAFSIQVGTADVFTFGGASLSKTNITNDTLVLTVNGVLSSDTSTYKLTQTVNGNLVTSVIGSKMANTAVQTSVVDAIAPSVASVVAGNSLTTPAPTTATPDTFTVAFSENVNAVDAATLLRELVIKDASGNILSPADFTVIATDGVANSLTNAKTFVILINPTGVTNDFSVGTSTINVSLPIPRSINDLHANLVNPYAGSNVTLTIQ